MNHLVNMININETNRSYDSRFFLHWIQNSLLSRCNSGYSSSWNTVNPTHLYWTDKVATEHFFLAKLDVETSKGMIWQMRWCILWRNYGVSFNLVRQNRENTQSWIGIDYSARECVEEPRMYPHNIRCEHISDRQSIITSVGREIGDTVQPPR